MDKTVTIDLGKLKELKNNKLFWVALVVVVLVVASFPGYYYYSQYKKTQAMLQNPAQNTLAETQQLINEVGKLIELPSNQTPTIATVSDITKLAGQPFFQNAKNGDKVLIYSQAKKAILYRPSENKIIEVAPVNVGASSSASLNAPVTAPSVASVSVVVYNGTATSGLAADAENKITAAMTNVAVLNTADAKNSYDKTEVIDLSGNNSTVATGIASLLGGEVIPAVPSGETTPNAQVLVILGSNFVK